MRQIALCKECYVKVTSTHRRYAVPCAFHLNLSGMVWIWPHGCGLCRLPETYAGKESTRREASQEKSLLQDQVESHDSCRNARRPAGHDVFHDRSHMAGPDQSQGFRLHLGW